MTGEQPRERANAIKHETSPIAAPHADAFATVANRPPVRDAVCDTSKGRVGGVANLDDLPLRDRKALRLLTQLRFLSYRQLREVSYPEAHASVTRRRVSQLLRAGAISVWEAPGRHGGHTRYAIPTAAATRTVVAAFSREVEATPYAPLIRLMLPQTAKRSLRLEGGAAAPNWFAHQVEVNALVLRLREEVPLLWMSSWDCPFPSKLASFDLPQPDYVIIEETPTGPRLVFGEHDRGSEPVDRFVARKVLLYAALSAFPEACTHHFGLPAFTVRVTVTDPVHRAPMRRLMDLLRATARAAGPEAAAIFRFALAGWLHAYPNEAIWFAPHDEPDHASVRWQQHTARHVN